MKRKKNCNHKSSLPCPILKMNDFSNDFLHLHTRFHSNIELQCQSVYIKFQKSSKTQPTWGFMNFSWMFDKCWNFMWTLWHFRFDRTLSYSAKGSAHKTPKLQNSSKFCDILEKSVSASVIGRLPIFFMTKQSF